ncbi:MAG: hypothetical protein IKL74_01140 [Clostridia bacterium]|nr:hypothetical protein [Clostridia bacterium]
MKKLIIWRLLILPIGFAVECAAATFAVYILKITSKTGLIVGAAAGILAAAVLYFLAGFKNHKASIPKISLWYFLWTVTVLVFASFFNSPILGPVAGGYILFSQINYFLPTGAEILCSALAFILEIFFLASGVLFGRHLDKKKAKIV